MSEFRRRLMMVRKAKPYDAEVEYILRNSVGGDAYIDTGIKVSNNVTFEIDAFTNDTIDTFIIGGRASYNNSQINVTIDFANNRVIWGWQNTSSYLDISPTIGDYYCSNLSQARTLTVNGNSISIKNSTFSISHNLFLMANNNAGSPLFGSAGSSTGIRKAKIYQSGTLVRDYIAVRVSQIGYLYDKVSKTLFGNANSTGAFLIGNDK